MRPPGRGGRRSGRPRRRPGARRPRRRRRRARRGGRSRIAADPGAEDRRRAGDRAASADQSRSGSRAVALVGERRGDAEALGDVVDHEADDQERAERELAERERRADREPLAEVVQADADRRRASPARARERRPLRSAPATAARRPRSARGSSTATPSSTSPAPPSAPGSAAWSSNASESASTPRKVSSPAVSAMNAASHFGSARRSDGSQSRPSAIGTTPTRKPIDRVAEEARATTRCGVSTAAGICFDRLDPGRARDPDRDRVVLDPVVRHDDRARAQPAELARAVERERHDRVVDRDRGDRQVVALRVRDADPDLARLELDAADVELVRRAAGCCRSGRRVTSRPMREQRRRRRRAGASGASAQSRQRARPSAVSARCAPSVDDVEEAHPAELGELRLVRVEHERARCCAKSISITPRWPWHCMTVSVYSQWSPVPVGW